MKTIYKDCLIDVFRDKSVTGEGLLFYSVFDEIDGYEVESVRCNGKEAKFDNYNWSLSLLDTNEEEITCEFVFRDTQTLANKILSSNTLITDTPTLTTSSNNTSDKSGLYKSI